MARKKAIEQEAPIVEKKEIELLDEKKEYKIEVIKSSGSLIEGNTYIVSGNVANILISKGLVKKI